MGVGWEQGTWAVCQPMEEQGPGALYCTPKPKVWPWPSPALVLVLAKPV